MDNNRRFMAMLHSRTKIPQVNEFIKSLEKSGRSGSTHHLHPRADYDFDLTSWATILHLFGDDHETLYPSTVDHIVSEMMAEERAHPTIYVPWTLGTFLETENHVLMTEGSYYLCSKWLEERGRLEGSDHSPSREREGFLSRYLDSILHKGLYEFNSDPYSYYTTHALMNLTAFSSDPIRKRARELLDRSFFYYLIGSSGHRRYPPFRRRRERFAITSMLTDGLRPYMIAWDGSMIVGRNGPAHSLIASLLPYRPPMRFEEDGP
jgi:hypothetical protein